VNEHPKSQISNPKSQGMEAETEDYCRQLEAHLCRKNDGHLIRIVGPAFEQVCGWAERGIPLTLAMRGIDRYFERYYSKGPRRRPVRIEFCEADVLDVFDEWRRAVGVAVTGEAGEASRAGEATRAGRVGEAGGASLPAHLERVIARLTMRRGGGDRSLDPVLDDAVRELDGARATAKTVRGQAREALIDRLRQIDASMIDALRQRTDDAILQQLAVEADEELKAFRPRMPPGAYADSRRACVDRLLRERAGLPTISYE